MDSQNTIRLDKYLANAGLVSRRSVDKYLKRNVVKVNNDQVFEGGVKVDPKEDQISVNNQTLKPESNLVYIMLNKPMGVVSTTLDEQDRPTVTNLVPSPVRLYPVGRLDSDSIGLILLTNDGELTHKLTHPKFHIPKTYEVLVKEKPTKRQLQLLRTGVELKDGKTSPAEVEIIEEFKFTTKLKFVLHEGRNRQIRRMCGKVGLEILELKRISIGPINLGDLELGASRKLTEKEIIHLKKSVDL